MRDLCRGIRKCACVICVAALIATPGVSNAQQLADNPLTAEIHSSISSTAAHGVMRAVVFGETLTVAKPLQEKPRPGDPPVSGDPRQVLRDGARRMIEPTAVASGQAWTIDASG